MAVYTFYLHERADGVPTFEIVPFDTETLALAHGEKLLRERPRYSFVEVTRDDASIAKLTRDAL